MICEHCGKVLDIDNAYCVVSIFATLQIQSAHMACKKCSEEVYQDCLQTFNKDLVERCITIMKVEAITNDLKQL